MKRSVVVALLSTVLLVFNPGCSRKPAEEAEAPAPAVPSVGAELVPEATAFRQQSAGRVVALGDIHGDLQVVRRVLRTAGAIDENDHWIGEDLVVVQTGDQVDRGPDDPDVIDFFERLEEEARAAGGKVFPLLGNHEIWNVRGYFGSVTQEGLEDFESFDTLALPDELKRRYPPSAWGRVAAFGPGGEYAVKMADRPVVLMVDDSLFVHGGVDMEHVAYGLERVNAETRAWLLGESEAQPEAIYKLGGESDTLTWLRRYSDGDPSEEDCAEVSRVLEAVGARRMVMGHTVQDEGINSVCNEKVWRIDVGLAEYYQGPEQALEIRGDQVRVLKGEGE